MHRLAWMRCCKGTRLFFLICSGLGFVDFVLTWVVGRLARVCL